MEMHERRAVAPIRISSEEFVSKVNTYPQEAQERISVISSMFLEPDVLKRIKETPDELNGLVTDLRGSGLSDKEVKFVFRYFTLPRPSALNQKKNLAKLP